MSSLSAEVAEGAGTILSNGRLVRIYWENMGANGRTDKEWRIAGSKQKACQRREGRNGPKIHDRKYLRREIQDSGCLVSDHI